MAFSYRINDVPDLDQRWNALSGNGANHCVPASCMNWMYHLEATAFPNTLPMPRTVPAALHVPFNISAMGGYMDTDPDSGTNHSDGVDGLCDWLGDQGIPAFVYARSAGDGDHVTYRRIRNHLKNGAHLVVKMGRYHREDGEFIRDSGHAMSLVRLNRQNTGAIEITTHDPAQDDGNRAAQTPPGDTRVAGLTESVRNIEGDHLKLLRWGTATRPFRFIDGYTAILPFTAVTQRSADALTTHVVDLGTGSVTSTDIALPFSGLARDLAISASGSSIAAIAQDTGEAWMFDRETQTWARLAKTTAATRLTFGGRDERLFVAAGRRVSGFNDAGDPLGHLELQADVDAMTFDPRSGALLVASEQERRLFEVTRSLQLGSHEEMPEVPGGGRLTLSAHGPDGELVLSREGSPVLTTARLRSGQSPRRVRLRAAASPSAAHADRRGRVLVSDHGRIAAFNLHGQRVRGSVFDGLPAGPLLKVTRTVNDHDRTRLDRPAWRDG